MKTILYVSFLILLISCNKIKKENETIRNNLIPKNITFLETDSVVNEYKENEAMYSLLHCFNGGCSMCIGEFIAWHIKWQENNISTNLKCLFISTEADMDILEYYLERAGIKFSPNTYFYIDNENKFLDANPKIIPDSDFYLLDENFRVVTNLDPVSSEEALTLFKKLKLIL